VSNSSENDSTHGASLRALFERRVIVCAGSGGVGKTSVAAALSVAAARTGKRVLTLTIDPAKRLADSMGVDRNLNTRQFVETEKLRSLGIDDGSLSVMMLDAGKTLRDMVAKLAPNEASAERIVNHPLFRYLGDYLAGANEYMAMEKLLSVLQEEDFDLLVLDTPPSRHALDFLDAPARLTDAIDGPVTRAFTQAVGQGGRWGLGLVAKGAAIVLKSIGKLTGAGLLEQVATLIAELNSIFGGFGDRARTVAAAFREPTFAYVLVTRPALGAIADTCYFGEALAERALTADAIVVNKVHTAPPEPAPTEELTQKLGPDLTARVHEAANILQRRVAREASTIGSLGHIAALAKVTQVHLPAVAGGVSNLEDLSALASVLGAEVVV
jgi:anion-transporting  ArsA/GET3 family ATPase